MGTGSLTSSLDVAQLVLYAFWIFFFALIYYLQRESHREGYPMETDNGKKLQGWPVPEPKTYLLAGGGEFSAPNNTVSLQTLHAAAAHRWAGADVGAGLGSKGGQKTDRTTDGWVPFHKLSQWMSYSLLEPLQWAGVTVTGLDALTGLPEYRNGGLLIDGGVIKPRDPRLLAKTWKPQDEFIIEWRALTVVLLDELAVLVRARLGKTAEELPLACILEGGTWAAGREIAQELRADGAPPLRIESDGTIF